MYIKKRSYILKYYNLVLWVAAFIWEEFTKSAVRSDSPETDVTIFHFSLSILLKLEYTMVNVSDK